MVQCMQMISSISSTCQAGQCRFFRATLHSPFVDAWWDCGQTLPFMGEYDKFFNEIVESFLMNNFPSHMHVICRIAIQHLPLTPSCRQSGHVTQFRIKSIWILMRIWFRVEFPSAVVWQHGTTSRIDSIHGSHKHFHCDARSSLTPLTGWEHMQHFVQTKQ